MNKIAFQAIIDYFSGKLAAPSSDIYANCIIHPETKELLQNVGLPINLDVLLLNFYYEDMIKVLTVSNNNYLVIGDDYGTFICIEALTGEVYSINSALEHSSRFINSSLLSFLQFIIIYINWKDSLIDADDNEASDIVNELKEDFFSIDDKALDSAENWWNIILEQHELGLM